MIEDDGRGFSAPTTAYEEGGIEGMRERVRVARRWAHGSSRERVAALAIVVEVPAR